jgi:hypothetical protein
MQNQLLRVLNRLPLNIGLIVLTVDLNVHAEDIPFKPTKFLVFSIHSSSSGPLSTRRSTHPSIGHKGARISSGRGIRILPLDIVPLDFVHLTIITKIKFLKAMLDKEHNVRSIWKCVSLNYGILDLLVDKVHHIQSEILIRVARRGTLMGKVMKINKRSVDGIIVTSTRGNVLSENTDKLIIKRKQTIDEADNTGGVIKINKLVLVRLRPWRVSTMTHGILPIKSITQKRGKHREICFTIILSRYPFHGLLFIWHDH